MRRNVQRLRQLAPAIALFSMLANSPPAGAVTPADQCRFIGIHRFNDFKTEAAAEGERVLVSPVIKAPIAWNELVVSWNARTPPDSSLKLEARGLYPDRQTKYYTIAVWSPDETHRHSVRRQKDADGDVKTDTWTLRQPGADVQLRITLDAANGSPAPDLRFLGLSFLNSRMKAATPQSDRSAWGKIIATPERSQHGYPNEKGWCSPASLSMVLARWSENLLRPEMNLTVPEVVSNIFDPVYGGTGNWAFNAAFAGSFDGMRAYVTRLSDITELETWINAGIPVVISARWNLLSPERPDTGSGHLVVCIGFTESGDVVINDPATNLNKGQKVRHIYKRADVIKAWNDSHNTVYLIYPESVTPPADPFGHWDKK